MAKDKSEKTADTSGKKDTKKSSFIEAATDQAILEFTKPLVEKIPVSLLKSMKAVGLEKLLPVLGVAVSTLIPKGKSSFGDSTADFVGEFSAELRRRINDVTKEGSKPESSASGQPRINIFNTILSPHLADKSAEMAAALVRILSDGDKLRPEKEREKIFSLLSQMGQKELVAFLIMEEARQNQLLSVFMAKADESTDAKGLAEVIRELRSVLSEGLKALNDEVIQSALGATKSMAKKIDAKAASWAETVNQKTEAVKKNKPCLKFW